MNEPGEASEQRDARLTIRATITAGAILVSVIGVAYLLTWANPGALGAASLAVFTTSLIGVIVTTYVVAVRQSVSRSAPPMDDIDAELHRILADARLGDLSSRRARGRGGP